MMLTKTEPGNVVQDYMRGNTRIRICDDYYRDKTPEDVEEILKRIGRIASAHLYGNHASGR